MKHVQYFKFEKAVDGRLYFAETDAKGKRLKFKGGDRMVAIDERWRDTLIGTRTPKKLKIKTEYIF